MSHAHEHPLHVVCMDCKATIRGTVGYPQSHGLCTECFATRMAEIDRLEHDAMRKVTA